MSRKRVNLIAVCDEWGGAESRGNGARPVEWMIMNDTCATHRSRVPRRSSGRNKRRSDNSGRRERTRPGVLVCALCAAVGREGLPRFICLFIYLLLNMLNVRRFPPPSSRIYQLCYIGAEAREEGGTRCQRALAAEWDRGAEEIGQQEVAETASGCPKRWCWSKRRTGGTEDSLPCSWVEEGWLSSERERRSRPVRLEAEACCHPPCLGEEQGTGDSLPAALDRRSHRRPPGGGGASGRPPERSSTIAWHREWAAQLVEDRAAVCPGTGPRFFFSSLPSLVSVTPHPSISFSLASSVLTPRYAAAALTGSPRERGEGGSRAQSREYPPACEGRWGYVTSGAGPRAVGTERGRWSEW